MRSPGVILKKGKEAPLLNSHQWIFSGAIHAFPDSFEEGHIYPVYSFDKLLLGHAYFRSKASLSGRIISFGEEDPWHAITRHLDDAILLRDTFFARSNTNAFRLINGEGDFLSGLIIDQYNDTLVLQSSTLGIDLLLPKIAETLFSKGRWKAIYEKSTSSARKLESIESKIGVLHGPEKLLLEIEENGLKFYVDWREGQKTGFFLDQREMRALIGEVSYEKTVLNCFSYTGGFSLYALARGASHVTSVDSSASALRSLEKNLVVNRIDANRHTSIEADAFQYLRQAAFPFDLVILDPPAFVKRRGDVVSGSKGYREINSQAMKKMKRNSLLLTCSCSHFIDLPLFKTLLFQAAQYAKREIRILQERVHGIDHPISLYHKEGSYLKSLLLALE